MKRYFSLVVLFALAVLTLGSCVKGAEEELVGEQIGPRTVSFNVSMADQTRTGLAFKFVPYWTETDVENVHLYEMYQGTAIEGHDVKMDIEEDRHNEVAHFQADFTEEMVIIINPPSSTSSVLTRAGETSEYTYGGIFAKKVDDTFVVPATQYPDKDLLIDPNADFLVGSSKQGFSKSQTNKDVDLFFVRPVAASRLAIMNIEGTVIRTVTITSTDKLTGAAKFADVNFETGEVAFDAASGETTLTLDYGDGVSIPAESTFYAYFISLAGAKSITSIEVTTDTYVYTKTFEGGKTLTFKTNDFKNIAVDMSKVTPTPADPDQSKTQNLSFHKNSGTITTDSFVLGSGDYVTPTLQGAAEGATVEWTVECNPEGVATVAKVEGVWTVTPVKAGTAIITATASAVDGWKETSLSYTLTVTEPATKTTFYKAIEIEAGEQYVIVSGGKALTAAIGAQDVTITNDTFEAGEGEYTLWTAAEHVEYYEDSEAAGHFTLKNGDNYLQRQSNQSEQTVIAGAVPSTGKYYVWDYDGEKLFQLSVGGSTLYHYCVNYDTEWTIDYVTSNFPATYLYCSTKPRTKQVISFGDEPVTAQYDLNGGNWTVAVPKLTGAQTTVTYESSNTAVVTVNASSGEVTIQSAAKKGDTAIITATAAKTDTYTSATASYTIEILDSTPVAGVTIKLEPATELVAGNQYVLVSNGKVLVRDGATAAAADFDATAVSVTVASELAENVTWTLGTNTDSNNRGNIYDFTNGGYYFGVDMNSEKNPYTYSIGLRTSKSASSTQNIQNHNIDLTNGYVYYKGNSSSQYIYFDTTAEAWAAHQESNGTFVAAYGTTLYQVKDERAEQNLQFSAAAAEYDLYSSTWTVAVPGLSGDKTTVTYASSDEAVATVDNSGNVTIASTAKMGDTATITATAAATTEYKEGSASYTITIVDNNPNVATYIKVTSADQLEADGQYLIVFEGISGDTDGDGDPKVFNPVLKSGDNTQFDKATSSALDVAISNGTIKSSAFEDCQFTLEEGYYLMANKAERYIYPGASGSSSVPLAEATPSHALTITFENGNALIKNDTRYIVWSTYNHYFSANTGFSSSNYSTYICLYKLQDSRTKQTLSFSADEAEYDIYLGEWTIAVPTLSGYQTTPVYSSSDEAVAIVDPSTGAVTIASTAKKGDNAIITATAPANDSYKKGKASYTISIVNSDPTAPTYYKASKIVAGETYLIVSNGQALVNNSGSAGATAVTVNDNQIQVDATANMLWTAVADGEKFNFSNDGKYLVRNSSNIQIGAKSGTTRNNQWSYKASSDDLMVSGSSSTYYLSYSSSSWSVGNSGNTALYTTTPPPDPSTYTLITETSELVSGGTYLIVSADAENYNKKDHGAIFAGDEAGTAVDVTATSGVITGAYADYEFVITASGSDYTLLGPNGYLTGNSGTSRYIQVSSTAVTMSMNRADEVKQDDDDGQVANAFYFYYLKSSSKEALYLNSDGKFKIGGSGRNIGVYLYKKN